MDIIGSNALPLLIVSWGMLPQTYFTPGIAEGWSYLNPVLAGICICLLGLKLRATGGLVPSAQGRRKLGLLNQFGYAFGFGAYAALVLLAAISLIFVLATFLTARQEVSFESKLTVTESRSGRCRIAYEYLNKVVDRKIRECGIPYADAKYGDNIIVQVKNGPLGVYVRSIAPKR